MDQNISMALASRANHVYSKLKKDADLKNYIISPSYLRKDLATAANNTQYTWRWKDSGDLSLPEYGLTDTDVFVIVAMGLHLYKVDTTKVGKEVPFAYPNSEHFGVAGVTPSDLEAFYNGLLTIVQNNTEIVKGMPTACFRSVPETIQESANLNIDHDSYDGVPGLKELPFAIVLNGQSKTEFRLQIPSFPAAGVQTSAANTEIRVSWFLSGFRIDSGAKVHYDRITKIVAGDV